MQDDVLQRALCKFKVAPDASPDDVRAFLQQSCFSSHNDDPRDSDQEFSFVTSRDIGRALRGWDVRLWVTVNNVDTQVGEHPGVGELKRHGQQWPHVEANKARQTWNELVASGSPRYAL
jgi:hypothetical protein